VSEIPVPTDEQIFAVVQINGFQHKVTKDDILKIDKLPYPVGSQVAFDHVMVLGTPLYTLLGRPYVDSNRARVICTVEEQTLSEKLIVFKYKRRKGYKRQQGHRKQLTILRVDRIEYHVDDLDATLLAKF
jgi:large subunit ribosomal protein L21